MWNYTNKLDLPYLSYLAQNQMCFVGLTYTVKYTVYFYVNLKYKSQPISDDTQIIFPKIFKGASEETLFWMMTWFLAVDYNNTKLSIAW